MSARGLKKFLKWSQSVDEKVYYEGSALTYLDITPE
jgi:hypothetical protein